MLALSAQAPHSCCMEHRHPGSTRPRRAPSLLLGLTLLAACGDPTGLPLNLVGSWHATESVQPAGSMERIFRFEPDWRFEERILFYGVYGDPASHLSASTVITGHYTRDHDRILLQGERETDWDGTYYPDPVTRDLGGTTLLDARFQIVLDQLTLFYDSYPADAPVPTTMRLTRMP